MMLVAPLVLMLLDARYGWALLIFFVAGFTDGLDGFLAKRFEWRSWLGGILDPLADKLLLVTTFVTLGYIGLVPIWLLAVVVTRDLVITSGAVAFRLLIGNLVARPTAISKINSAAQLLYVLLVVANEGFGIPGNVIVIALGWIVLATTAVSGLDYVYTWGTRAWRLSHSRR